MKSLLFLLLLAGCSRLEPVLAPGESCQRTEVLDPFPLPEHVDWRRAAPQTEHRVLDLWCETVGPAVFDPTPAPPDTGAVKTDSIAVISWNTRVGGADIEQLVRDLRAGRLTGGDSVHHFILLLQEVYRTSDSVPARVRVSVPERIAEHPPNGQRRDITATSATLGLAVLYVPSMRNGSEVREDRGNAILSTMELNDPHAIVLPFERQRRVVTGARVSGSTSTGADWELTALSVHFDNRSRLTRITASLGVARLRQARALVENLEQDDNAAIIVAGDMNTWSLGWLERSVPYLRHALSDTPEPQPEITYVKGRVRRRIDYMFFQFPEGWHGRYERIDRMYGSDHYPLLGWVRFGERGTATQ